MLKEHYGCNHGVRGVETLYGPTVHDCFYGWLQGCTHFVQITHFSIKLIFKAGQRARNMTFLKVLIIYGF